ncbi:MAG: DegT/DnrJ/EryC1/StrS family aminotransferase, partial [Ruthenibacterium sp.]
MEKLAALGGKPVRDTQLYYGRQCIEEDDIKAVEEVLRGRLITCGPHVEELEKKLCEVAGAKYAVALSNGT